MTKKFKLDSFGYEAILGEFAKQANGAVWLQQGGTVVLATVVASPAREFPGFLPLTIDYREQLAAAGKIPGGYFKREGRSSEKEVLTSRLIDRPIRPLFPAHYFNQVQILITVYSVDKKHTPDNLALIASSLALSISDIPFLGPIASVEVGRINGKWVINPLYDEIKESDVRLIVAGTQEGINMVEGSMEEISEQELVDALFLAHGKIKEIVAWQKEVQAEVGQAKAPIEDTYNWSTWEERISQFITQDLIKKSYIADKVQRNEYLKSLLDQVLEKYKEDIESTEVPKKVIEYIFDTVLKRKVTELIFEVGKRIDGRSFDQVRKISSKIGLLPSTHGSALFNRGNTQALVTATLGGGQDEQRMESLMGEDIEKNFMLHYNFPPFSVGEVRPIRGPGRREIGHGVLAASALRYMLPSKEQFPYTIRVVADMLESDGSTSMATTCGSTLALMDAAVPLKRMVSGIAMGLLMSQSDKTQVLSDISGFEDAYGMMDFKITGTSEGITAVQMDIKYKGGLARSVFENALEQSRTGRLHILHEMQKTITEPKKELSPLVPRVITIKINPDKIGAIIGSGGKTIREIIEVTKTTIDVEPDGLVKIFATPEADADKAISWVKTLSGQIESGSRYTGKVRRLVDFGMFVELVPGLDGLVHISNIPRDKQRTFLQQFKTDDVVTVEVLDHDASTGRISLRLIEDKS